MFTELYELMNGFNVKMSIQKRNEVLSVSIQPVQVNDEKESFPPLILTGTPEELDAEFIPKIKNAMIKTSGIISNIGFYADQMKKKEDTAKEKATAKASSSTKAGATKVAAADKKTDLFETEKTEE